MDILYAFIGGLSAKIYDDIVDTPIEVSDVVKESLKGIQWMCLTLLCIRDFNFLCIIYGFVCMNYISNPDAYSSPYEFSLMLLGPVFFLLSMDTFVFPSSIEMCIYLYMAWVSISEPYLDFQKISHKGKEHEKNSTFKFMLRYNTLMFCLFWGAVYLYFIPSPSLSLIKFAVYGIAYLISSSAFQFYMLHERIKTEEGYKQEVAELSADLMILMKKTQDILYKVVYGKPLSS